MRAGRLLFGACLAWLGLLSSARGGDEVPAWLKGAASSAVPVAGKKVPAVVLLQEKTVTVEADGRVRATTRCAIKVLDKEGRAEAVAREAYQTDSGKIKDLRAWLLRPSGEVKRYGKAETLDVALVENDVYNEARLRVLSARDDAEVGAVFGYESATEERPLFAQDVWSFQERLPVRVSRYTLTLPSGWRAKGTVFNHATAATSVAGQTWSWELRDLPQIDDEPASPPLTRLAPRLAVSYSPEGPAARTVHSFASWADVARWASDLVAPQSEPDAALTAKALELVRDARTELLRIGAIARYVQGINYISIQIGVGRYKPHAAAQVFARSYGDCKDKANLMRAMLKVVGIPSHLVLIYSGDADYVREEWPSPWQFNHAIIAVRLAEPPKAGGKPVVASLVDHPRLGRLLLFDPTDEHTPLGELPEHEQGSLAVVAAPESAPLLRMPLFPADASKVDRQTEATLDPQGLLTASVRELSIGGAAGRERRAFHGKTRSESVQRIEAWVSRAATGARISRLEHADDSVNGRFTLEVEFKAPYGQLMQGRLLVFKPLVLSRRDALFLTEPVRKHPVVLAAHSFTDTVRIKLPQGFVVDELPEPVSLETAFGTYATTVEARPGELVVGRRLVLKRATIPPEQYGSVRGFYEKIRAAEQTPVVLMKK